MSGWSVLSKPASLSKKLMRSMKSWVIAQALFSVTMILASLTNKPGVKSSWEEDLTGKSQITDSLLYMRKAYIDVFLEIISYNCFTRLYMLGRKSGDLFPVNFSMRL